MPPPPGMMNTVASKYVRQVVSFIKAPLKQDTELINLEVAVNEKWGKERKLLNNNIRKKEDEKLLGVMWTGSTSLICSAEALPKGRRGRTAMIDTFPPRCAPGLDQDCRICDKGFLARNTCACTTQMASTWTGSASQPQHV